MSVFNIFMLKYLCDSRNLCIAEHLRPQKQSNHKADLAGRCLHLFFLINQFLTLTPKTV